VAITIDDNRLLAGSSMKRDDDIANNDNKTLHYYFLVKIEKVKLLFVQRIPVFGNFTKYF
jgi:hypothetical protein